MKKLGKNLKHVLSEKCRSQSALERFLKNNTNTDSKGFSKYNT